MRRRVAGLLLGVLMLAVLAWAPPAAAASKCLIINDALNASYRSLQPAQDAAAAGATLWVRGSCVGTTTITKDLTLTGQQPPGFPSPTLDGAGQGSVLTITGGVTVTINTLTIRGGNAERGGGILNDGGTNAGGTVTLNHSTVSDNTAAWGGGIANNGPLTLNHSSISGNTADRGGGIFNADRVGSIFEAELGTLTLNDTSRISDNTAEFGGGIYSDLYGTVTLNDTSSITRNAARSFGGGIYNIRANLNLNGSSSVSGNAAPNGGGIFNNGPVTLNDSSSITRNHAEVGGGIRNNRIVNLNDSSSISDNTAEFNGGGIYNSPAGTVGLNGGTVTNNIPDDIYP